MPLTLPMKPVVRVPDNSPKLHTLNLLDYLTGLLVSDLSPSRMKFLDVIEAESGLLLQSLQGTKETGEDQGDFPEKIKRRYARR
jgi:hypothetical protein